VQASSGHQPLDVLPSRNRQLRDSDYYRPLSIEQHRLLKLGCGQHGGFLLVARMASEALSKMMLDLGRVDHQFLAPAQTR
jgi:hypothetical protein